MRPAYLASGTRSRRGAPEPLQRGADAARPRARGTPSGEVPECDRSERRLAGGASGTHPRGDRRGPASHLPGRPPHRDRARWPRSRDRRHPGLHAPGPPRLRDPRLEARAENRQHLPPRDRAAAPDLWLALRAGARRAAGRSPGPQRDRRDRRHPLRRRLEGARGPRRDSPPEAERGGAGRDGRLVQVLGLRVLRSVLAGGCRTALGRALAVGRPRAHLRARVTWRRDIRPAPRSTTTQTASQKSSGRGARGARRSARRPSASSRAPVLSPPANRSSWRRRRSPSTRTT